MPPLSLSAHSARVKVLSDRRLEGRDEPAPGQQRGTGQRLGGYSVGKLGPPRGARAHPHKCSQRPFSECTGLPLTAHRCGCGSWVCVLAAAVRSAMVARGYRTGPAGGSSGALSALHGGRSAVSWRSPTALIRTRTALPGR